MVKPHQSIFKSEDEQFYEIKKLEIKTSQAILILEKLKSDSDQILDELSRVTDDEDYKHYEYELSDVNYNKLRGKVDRQLTPFIKNINQQISVIINNYHEIFEKMSILFEEFDKPKKS